MVKTNGARMPSQVQQSHAVAHFIVTVSLLEASSHDTSMICEVRPPSDSEVKASHEKYTLHVHVRSMYCCAINLSEAFRLCCS